MATITMTRILDGVALVLVIIAAYCVAAEIAGWWLIPFVLAMATITWLADDITRDLKRFNDAMNE